MFKLIEFLKKRPTDTMIRILRVVGFGGLAALLIWTIPNYTLPFAEHYSEYELYAQYAVAALFIIIALVFGAAGLCIFKRSTMKKVQMITGLLLIILGSTLSASEIKDYNTNKCITPDKGGCDTLLNLSEYTAETSNPLTPAAPLIIIGILTLLGGLTGKMVTNSCIKYREVIQKIRV
jgi:hypothetical protein